MVGLIELDVSDSMADLEGRLVTVCCLSALKGFLLRTC